MKQQGSCYSGESPLKNPIAQLAACFTGQITRAANAFFNDLHEVRCGYEIDCMTYC